MYSASAEFQVKIRRDEGIVEAVVNHPSDEQWAERHKRRKVFIRPSRQRGASETEVVSGPADLWLYNQIRQVDQPDLDAEEASMVIDKISSFDVVEVNLGSGNDAVVIASTPAGEVTHTLTIPSTKETVKFRRSSKLMNVGSKQQLFTDIAAASDLYDAHCTGSTGYSGGVPMHHKDNAIRAVLDFIDQLDSENFPQ